MAGAAGDAMSFAPRRRLTGNEPLALRRLPGRLHLIEQVEHGQPQGVRDDFYRVERGVRPTVLNSTHVGLIEATTLCEFDLRMPVRVRLGFRQLPTLILDVSCPIA